MKVIKKLNIIHGVFYAMNSFMPVNTLRTLYYSLTYPALTYHVVIWGGISPSHTVNIKIIMNKILRIILRVRYDDNHIPLVRTNTMYRDLKIFQFNDIYRYFLLKFVHYCFYKNLNFYHKYFVPLLPCHSYSTRNVRILQPQIRLNIEKQSTFISML